MDVTKAHNPNSMILASAKIEITDSPVVIDKQKKDWSLENLIDLGLARGIKISFTSSQIDIKADNGTVPFGGETDRKAKVEFSLLERDLLKLNTAMKGLVTVKEVFGPKDISYNLNCVNLDYDLGNAMMRGNGLMLPLSDKSKTPTIRGVYNETNFIAFPADAYNLMYDDFYKTWLIRFDDNFIGGGLDDSFSVDATIETITGYRLTKGSSAVAENIAMKLTNKRKADDGRILTNTFEFPSGHYTGDDSISFKSKNEQDNIAEVPMSFEFSAHPDMVDDTALANMSLYRETREY